MKKLLLCIVLLIQSVLVLAQPADSYIKSILDAGKIPGASMVVVKDGHWLYSRSIGHANIAGNVPMDRQRLFLLSSASDMVIATAVMQLWEKGILNLDIDVSNYLPFQLIHPHYTNDSITTRMLLTHTASIDDNMVGLSNLTVPGDCPVSLDSLARNYFHSGGIYYNASQNFTTSKPGTQWQFSNMSMVLSAYIVEKMTGDQFSHYSDTAIFRKLCMKNTAYFLSDIADTTIIARPYSWDGSNYMDNGLYGCPGYPAVMLRSSVTAMARFMGMYMAYGKYRDERILDSATVVQMMQPYAPSASQGLGFYSRMAGNGDRIWGQDGGMWGATAAMYFNYSTKTGVIMLMNGEAKSNPMQIMDTLYKYGVSAIPKSTDTFPACDEPMALATVKAAHDDVLLYPNPSRGYVNVLADGAGTLTFYDVQGRMKMEQRLHKGNNLIELTGLPAGVYFAHIRNDDGIQIAVKRLICTQ